MLIQGVLHSRNFLVAKMTKKIIPKMVKFCIYKFSFFTCVCLAVVLPEPEKQTKKRPAKRVHFEEEQSPPKRIRKSQRISKSKFLMCVCACKPVTHQENGLLTYKKQ